MVKRLPEIVNAGMKKRLVSLEVTLNSSLIDSDTQRRWNPRISITIQSIRQKHQRNICPKVVVPLTACGWRARESTKEWGFRHPSEPTLTTY